MSSNWVFEFSGFLAKCTIEFNIEFNIEFKLSSNWVQIEFWSFLVFSQNVRLSSMLSLILSLCFCQFSNEIVDQLNGLHRSPSCGLVRTNHPISPSYLAPERSVAVASADALLNLHFVPKYGSLQALMYNPTSQPNYLRVLHLFSSQNYKFQWKINENIVKFALSTRKINIFMILL